MEIIGHPAEASEVAEVLVDANVRDELHVGSLRAKWLTKSGGDKEVLVESLNGDYIRFYVK